LITLELESWRREESEYSGVLKTRNLLIFRDAKIAENCKIAANWNVSGTRDFQLVDQSREEDLTSLISTLHVRVAGTTCFGLNAQRVHDFDRVLKIALPHFLYRRFPHSNRRRIKRGADFTRAAILLGNKSRNYLAQPVLLAIGLMAAAYCGMRPTPIKS